MLANNRLIHWLPEHIRDGRFGNFLESNVDWALSRERYWGTPLPIWVCEATGYMEAIGSYEELRQKPGAAGFEVWEKAKAANPALADHLRIHKPYIDAVTYDSPQVPGKRMRRVPDVIDCWFDSGAMPFAQWGYPHKRSVEAAIPRTVSRRFHQRGDRPDPRLVLQPVGHQHAVVRKAAEWGASLSCLPYSAGWERGRG